MLFLNLFNTYALHNLKKFKRKLFIYLFENFLTSKTWTIPASGEGKLVRITRNGIATFWIPVSIEIVTICFRENCNKNDIKADMTMPDHGITTQIHIFKFINAYIWYLTKEENVTSDMTII